MGNLIQRATKKSEKILVKLRQLREEKRYNRETIAEFLDIDTSTYTRIEHGQSHLRMDTFFAITEILGVSPISLFVEEEPYTFII